MNISVREEERLLEPVNVGGGRVMGGERKLWIENEKLKTNGVVSGVRLLHFFSGAL